MRAALSAAFAASLVCGAAGSPRRRHDSSAPLTSNAACPLTAHTTIAVYADESGGVGPGSHAWTARFFAWWAEPNPDLEVVELLAKDVNTNCALDEHPSLVLYVQPGGDAENQSQALGASGRDNILNYLFYGKEAHYMGTCAGSYYASGTYFWFNEMEGSFLFTPHLFATQEGPITEIAAYPLYAPTTVMPGDDRTTANLTMVYYGGPALGLNLTSAAAASAAGTVLTRYGDIRGGAIAASLRTPQLLLHSPHPEAVEGVHLACEAPLPPGCITSEQRLANWQWLAHAINEHVGKKWVVPTALGRHL